MKPVIIIAIAFILLIPSTVLAQSNNDVGTLDVGQDTYEVLSSEKLFITISGNIKYTLGTKMVTLSIVNPNNEPDGVKLVPSSNGNFEHTIEFNSESIKGEYKVFASYNGDIFETKSFVLKEKKLSIEDILKARGEKIDKEEPVIPEPVDEPIPDDHSPVSNQSPVPNFADPNKDPQYYLDRYYNEIKYKLWFDRNYPDYTIEEAVGFVPKSLVPIWVKNISLWFGEGTISEVEFLDAVSFLITNNILQDESYSSLEDKGNFQVVYDTTNNSKYIKIQNDLKQLQFFEKKSKDLNSKLNLPGNILVNIAECNEINAFYYGDTDTIVMCYEMMEFLDELFTSLYDDEQTIRAGVNGAMEFFFLHELGHALIDVYGIPITGMEEDAVDQLATIILLQKGNDGIAAIAATSTFFGIQGMSVTDVGQLSFADEHSLDLQRFYNILCFTYGSDVTEYGILIDLNLLPEERSIRCTSEYSQISQSWNTLLAPYEKSTSLIDG
jgi:hypothetical protein